MRFVIATALAGIVASVLTLTGCTASQQVAAGALVDAVAPAVASAIPGAAPVLTASAALGCAIQAAANAQGNSTVSQLAGVACKW